MGLGSDRIVDQLNIEGYKPSRSMAFQKPTIKRNIKNEAYKGTLVINDRKRVKENGKYVYKILETVSTLNAHPPIIPVDDWERATGYVKISRSSEKVM